MVPTQPNALDLSPDRLTRHLLVAVAVLLFLSVTGQLMKFFFGHDHLFGLIRLTYVNGEATIPSWFSASILLFAAVALAAVGAIKRRAGDAFGWYWTTLALGFVYLSMDEASAIHELWGEPIEARFAPGGYLRFAWVIPALLLVGAAAIAYARFVWSLPTITRRLFLLAGGLFVGSAVGVEMLGANYVATHGSGTFAYSMLVTLEEAGEMLGVIVFLYAVLRYLSVECGAVYFTVALPEAAALPDRRMATATPDLVVKPASSQIG